MTLSSYAVITPARNEVERIGKTIDSMVHQTLLPAVWVIVDDGSSDGTTALVQAAMERHSWIRLVRRPDRGGRKPGGGVVEAFYDGYRLVKDLRWDYLVKLDADVTFGNEYFKSCIGHFQMDPTLGIGGGTICVIRAGKTKVESPGDPPFHVRGATKIYRRRCWQEIEPLVQAPGWDTIDEVKANMRGWATRTFAELPLIQLKGTGTADGVWRNWFKNGRGCYVTGYDPMFMLAKCLKRSLAQPPVLPGLALAAGFCSGYIEGLPRVPERQVIRYLRRQQRHRMLFLPSIYR